jgi:hypothetical protein
MTTMGLRKHKTPTQTMPLLEGNTLTVRGLNLDDFTALLTNHLEPMSKAAALYDQHKKNSFSDTSFNNFMLTVAADFPGLVSEVISMCEVLSPEEEAEADPDEPVPPLGVGFQLTALSSILTLTVQEAGGMGNLFAQLAQLGKGVKQGVSVYHKKNPLPRSTGKRVKQPPS